MKKKKPSKAKKKTRKTQKKVIKPKKASKPAKKKISKKKPAAGKSKKAPKVPKVSFGPLVAIVTHYFPHVQAAVIKVKVPKLCLGETLHFKGHTTDFKLCLDSMQMDRKPITQAGKGAEIGVQVPSRVREGDNVYRPAK